MRLHREEQRKIPKLSNQEVGTIPATHCSFNPTQFHEKGLRATANAYDAGRKLDIRKKNNQFTQSQASEKDGALTNHTIIIPIVIR